MDRPTNWLHANVAVLAALAVVVIWGTNFVFLKTAFDEFNLATFLFLRYVGMIALAWGVVGFAWRRGNREPVVIAHADLGRVAVTGALGYSIYITLSMAGLRYTTAFSNALLLATAPMFVALLLWLLRLEPIAAGQPAAMTIAFLGVALFLGEKLERGASAASLGDLISLAAAFFFAAYNVAGKPLPARYPSRVVTAWTLTIGAAPVILFSVPSLWSQDWSGVSTTAWVVLAWAIVMPVYVAWTVWAWVNHRDGVARTSVFIYLVPIVGGVTSWALLGEGFGAQKVAGAALTLAGLVLARRWATRAKVRRVRSLPTVMSD